MAQIFNEAINTMKNDEYREPQSFQEYLKQNNFTAKNTANYISIQTYEQLASELKQNNLMVFRLGSQQGIKGTLFSLIKTDNYFKDYFLFDKEIFQNIEQEHFTLNWNCEELISFSVIPKLTETSHVNLALVTGLLEQALSLDKNSITIPATGRGNYTFQVKPKSKSNISWEHTNGQVEIDSIFAGTRNGQKHLFIIEAKSGKFPSSLAKHKLIYPICAIAPKISSEYLITPIYMRVKETEDSIIFYIAECNSYQANNNFPIDSLTVYKSSILKITK
jgi:hypothetical protein